MSILNQHHWPLEDGDYYTPSEQLQLRNDEARRQAVAWLDENGTPINTAQQRQNWHVWMQVNFGIDEHDYHTPESQSAYINSMQIVQERRRERQFVESWWQARQRKHSNRSKITTIIQIVGVAVGLLAAVWMYVEGIHPR